MKLLIDSGNTRLKWGWADNHHISTTGALFNSGVSFTVLVEIWQTSSVPRLVVISCVNTPQMVGLIESVVNFLWPQCSVHVARSMAFQCGVRNAYPQPEKLGVDRWLSLIAVYLFYDRAACIVDCGTAITVDLIDAYGHHQGGMISPGLTLMKQSLSRGTHRLPLDEQVHCVGLASDTEAAIYNGTLLAACGLIEHVFARQTDPVQLVLTGGDAKLIATQLACPAIMDDTLVLRGLDYVSDHESMVL